jgi:ion channel-forming bestrophin family protein
VGHILGPVLTVTLFSAAIVYAHGKGKMVTLTNSVTPLLAVVVSYPIVEET